jgi:uncharacterized protein YuzE
VANGGSVEIAAHMQDTILDMDAQGNICSITVEHASTRADAPHFSYEEVAA